MSVDVDTVKRIARLARIAVTEEEARSLQGELSAILRWVEQLGELDVDGVPPMTSVVAMKIKTRSDTVTDGNRVDDIIGNAPETEDNYFVVPKVVD
jgi:aspartyl-tRNA(Asn)/glutamyl-tRNA(Gln) amidotransferase subunit C